MSNINQIKKDVSELSKKVKSDIKNLLDAYKEFQINIEDRFREEVREQGGKMDGLEDFYNLNMFVKRNTQIIGNALNMMTKIKDVSGFDISEIIDTAEQNKIKELVS